MLKLLVRIFWLGVLCALISIVGFCLGFFKASIVFGVASGISLLLSYFTRHIVVALFLIEEQDEKKRDSRQVVE